MQKKQCAGLERVSRTGWNEQRRALSAARSGLHFPSQWKHFVCRPVPIFEECNLRACDRWTGQLHMRIPPRADLWIASEILIPHIQSADPRRMSIHHHDLAMIAKVQLPTIR